MRCHAVMLPFLLVLSGGCIFYGAPLGHGGVSLSGAGSGGSKVVETGKRLSFVDKKIFRGSCWTFVEGVYLAAGFPESKRATVFRRTGQGAYADPGLLEPGDWVMHYNLEFGNVDHSSIFVAWVDRARSMARTLDHVGMNRPDPGRYRDHNMSRIFGILRAKAEKAPATPVR